MSVYRQPNTRSNQCIIRFQEADEEEPPWAGIRFVHEVGSDELSELLKARYPSLAKHRQRKFMAVYDFFRNELLRLGIPSVENSAVSEGAEDSRMSNPPSDADMFHDPFQSTGGGQTAGSHSSPVILSSNESPRLTERPRSSVTHSHSPGMGASGSGPSTYVFSLVDGRQHLQRTKKKMSIKEREDYRRTRERGACSKCKRLKAKCTHDMESLSPQQQPSELTRPAKRVASPTPDGSELQSMKVPKTGEGLARARTPQPHLQQHSRMSVVETVNVSTEGQWANTGSSPASNCTSYGSSASPSESGTPTPTNGTAHTKPHD